MIRVGRYDAFDKWAILCRYWADRGSVADIGNDKFNRPRLPQWDAIAAHAGARAAAEYFRLKANAVSAMPPAEGDAAVGEGIAAELAGLLREAGYEDLQGRVRQLAEAIAARGVAATVDNGLSPRLSDRLRDAFKAGSLHALRWTEDIGEVPTIEILREQRPSTFPTQAIRQCRQVLCVFSAWFYGRSDVIHVYDAGPDHVTLVDLHQPSLDDMKLIYPAHWSFVCADFRDFLVQAAAEGKAYDLVVCDPFRGVGTEVAWNYLPAVMRLCTGTFITNYFHEMFGELGVAGDDADGLSRAIAARTGVDVAVAQILPRNADVSWVVMRRR